MGGESQFGKGGFVKLTDEDLKEMNAIEWVDLFCERLNLGKVYGDDIPKYEFFKDKLREAFQLIWATAYNKGVEDASK